MMCPFEEKVVALNTKQQKSDNCKVCNLLIVELRPIITIFKSEKKFCEYDWVYDHFSQSSVTLFLFFLLLLMMIGIDLLVKKVRQSGWKWNFSSEIKWIDQKLHESWDEYFMGQFVVRSLLYYYVILISFH